MIKNQTPQISDLRAQRDIMKFAGAWKMSDNEYEKIKADFERIWKYEKV